MILLPLLVIVMSLCYNGHKVHAQEVYLWKIMITSFKQEKAILTRTRFIPLVIKQLKNLRLSAIFITLCIYWKETITHITTHMINAIISSQTNLSNIVMKVLAGHYNILDIQIHKRLFQIVTKEKKQLIMMIA